MPVTPTPIVRVRQAAHMLYGVPAKPKPPVRFSPIMDTSLFLEQFQRMRKETQQAICWSQVSMREIRVLVEQTRASCQASRALLEALDESPLIDQGRLARIG